MSENENNPFQVVLDLVLQFTEQSLNLIQKTGPIIHHLRTNDQLQQLLQTVTDFYRALPESVSMALTVAVIFASSLLVFRVGRSVIGVLVIAIQVAIVMAVAYVMWILRDPLSGWLEKVLN